MKPEGDPCRLNRSLRTKKQRFFYAFVPPARTAVDSGGRYKHPSESYLIVTFFCALCPRHIGSVPYRNLLLCYLLASHKNVRVRTPPNQSYLVNLALERLQIELEKVFESVVFVRVQSVAKLHRIVCVGFWGQKVKLPQPTGCGEAFCSEALKINVACTTTFRAERPHATTVTRCRFLKPHC